MKRKAKKNKWFYYVGLSIIGFYLLSRFGCKAHTESVTVDEIPTQYSILIIYDTNSGLFKGRESFLRTVRDWYFIEFPKKEGPVGSESITYHFGDIHKKMRPNSGFIEVKKQQSGLELVVQLFGRDNIPFPINGKYLVHYLPSESSSYHVIYYWEE